MPASAYALVGFFSVVSIVSGIVAWRAVGPPSPLAALPPVGGAFAALYLVGHRLGVSLGPTMPLFGFEVALPFDVGVALGTAGAVAAAERLAWRGLASRGRANGRGR